MHTTIPTKNHSRRPLRPTQLRKKRHLKKEARDVKARSKNPFGTKTQSRNQPRAKTCKNQICKMTKELVLMCESLPKNLSKELVPLSAADKKAKKTYILTSPLDKESSQIKCKRNQSPGPTAFQRATSWSSTTIEALQVKALTTPPASLKSS